MIESTKFYSFVPNMLSLRVIPRSPGMIILLFSSGLPCRFSGLCTIRRSVAARFRRFRAVAQTTRAKQFKAQRARKRRSLNEFHLHDIAEAMALMGHKITIRPEPWGGGQMVAFDRKNGTLVGASDARKDGLALGY